MNEVNHLRIKSTQWDIKRDKERHTEADREGGKESWRSRRKGREDHGGRGEGKQLKEEEEKVKEEMIVYT